MRIYTAAPAAFLGDETFFARDSGLTARGFQSLGIDCKSILLEPSRDNDLSDVIRASMAELHSPAWWQTLRIDFLILYSWGRPIHRPIVVAARSAGISVVQVTDTQGISSPLGDWRAHLSAEMAHFWYESKLKRLLRTLFKLPYTCVVRILSRDIALARTIASSELFLAPTPSAASRFRRIVRTLRGEVASQNVHFVPFPANFHFTYNPNIQKKEEVIAVGRWDSLQKRTPLLIDTISMALDNSPSVRFRIFGKSTPELDQWHAALTSEQRFRVVLEGLVPNGELVKAYQSASVMLVSAAYEGCHNASVEAVCCGASVVACRSPFLGALEWHTSKNSGRLAEKPTAPSLCQALLEELDCWKTGMRDPVAISNGWQKEVHPQYVASRILDLLNLLAPDYSV